MNHNNNDNIPWWGVAAIMIFATGIVITLIASLGDSGLFPSESPPAHDLRADPDTEQNQKLRDLEKRIAELEKTLARRY